MVEHSPQILASEGKATMLRNQAVVDKTDTVLDIRQQVPGKRRTPDSHGTRYRTNIAREKENPRLTRY